METLPFNNSGRMLYAAIGDVHGDLPSLAAAVDAISIGPSKALCRVSFW